MIPESKEYKVRPEQKAIMVRLENKDHKVSKVKPEILENRVFRV